MALKRAWGAVREDDRVSEDAESGQAPDDGGARREKTFVAEDDAAASQPHNPGMFLPDHTIISPNLDATFPWHDYRPSTPDLDASSRWASRSLGTTSNLTACSLASVNFDQTSSSPSVQISSTTSTASSEEGQMNFGIVLPRVYRSSYPKSSDFDFIKSLGLKTVVTLGQRDEQDEVYAKFLTSCSIRHHIIDMKGTKKQSIPLQTMQDILKIVLDQKDYPLLIHCNHGRHRTGCAVGVIRKLSGWELSSILDEYRTFATPKVRDCDLAYITEFNIDDLASPVDGLQCSVKSFLRTTIFAFGVLVLWTITGSRGSIHGRDPRALQ